jgi:hypothetical protein
MGRLRIGFAFTGFALGVLSVARDDHRLAWAAIASLAISLILRLLNRRVGTSGTNGPV